VHVWRFPQGNDTFLPGTPLKPRALSWSSDSQLLATTDGPDVMVWNFAGDTPMPPPPVRLVGPPSLTTAVAFGPGTDLLATGYRDGMVHLWKPREHDQTVGVQPLDGQIESLAWGPPTPDGPLLLAASTAAGSLAVWVIDQRASSRTTANTAEKVRRDTGNLPTLYLHKLR